MSDIDRDPRWQMEAQRVAGELNRGDMNDARNMLNRDLMQLQMDPHAQHEFLNMVKMNERPGGADLQILGRDQYGREQFNITPPYYGPGPRPYYPEPYPQPYPPPVVVRPDPGEVIGGAVVGGVIGGLLGGALRHRHFLPDEMPYIIVQAVRDREWSSTGAAG